MVESEVMLDGGVESDQVVPPFWVTMMEATLAPLSPTATQVVVLAIVLGAQETALTLASGVYPAVVCHVGVTAAAAAVDIGTWLPRTPMRATAIMEESAVTVTPRIPRTATSLQDGEPTK
jgi:hypothetical protein